MTSKVIDDTANPGPSTDEEPRLLHEFFERQVRLRPDSPAVEFNDEVLTYSQLNRIADRVAAFLQARGVVRGSLVALYLEKSCGLFAVMLGVLKAGAGYVPLDPKFPVGRIISILEDAAATILITDCDLGGELAPQTSTEVIFLDDLNLDPQAAAAPPPSMGVTPEDVCYVIYTSGSTGRPKGVVIEHRNAVNFVRALWSVYKLTPRDRIYQGFSIAFDASIEEIWGALAVGGTLVVPSSEIARSALDAAAFINTRKITYFSTVPSLLAMMTTDLPTVRLLVVGGEACSPELVHRWVTPARRMMNTYGPTEATVVATAADCVPGLPVTIGAALPGYFTYVLDEQLRPVNLGEAGELFIGGDSVARGYLNRAELTAERFIADPFAQPGSKPSRLYQTRDLVRLTEDGSLQFLGRADAQIKIRGFRIELSEIEAVLMEQPTIQTAAVNVIEFGNLKELAAYVVLESNVSDLDRDSIAEALRSRLPEYMIPRYLDVVDYLPQMTSGKVDRKLLPPPLTIFGRAKHEIAAPTTDTERAIVDIWQQVFQVSPISVDDDFFLDLRGHSLFAAQAVTELRARLATVHVSIPDLYQYRTARRLAQHIDVTKAAVAAAQAKASASEAAEAAPSIAARAPLPWFCVACVVLQFFGLIAFYAVVFAPMVFAIVLILKFSAGEVELSTALNLGTTVAYLVWPSWLLLSIAVKWLVIGRYKTGRYPIWGFYYFRWWLVSRFQGLSWSEMFVGTPLMSLYYRAMGAKVGRHCSIDTPYCTAFDLVTIGEDTSIGSETQMLGYRLEDGWLILGGVTIGSECFVGTHCCLGLNAGMNNRSRLDDMSHLADDAAIEADCGMCGSPAIEAQVDVDALQTTAGPARYRPGQTFWFGLIHLVLIYAMGYLLILSVLPGLAMVAYAFFRWGPFWAVGAAFAGVPVSLFWYLFLVVAVKRLAIGRIAPGIHLRQSMAYLRYWFLAYLLTNTRHIVLQLYATMYLPTLLRLMGARIGYGAEISTAMRIVPDLLEIGDGGFLADACIVGGHRTYLGLVELRSNKIGERSFIGNSAMVPAGIDIGNDCLIGVMSTPPRGTTLVPDGTRWLGSPGFELPHTQELTQFTDRQTFKPIARLIESRAGIEFVRIMLPDIIAVAEVVLFCASIAWAYSQLPLWTLAIIAPGLAFVFSFLTVATVAGIKKLLIGKFEPVVTPFWSSYVWLNDVINALFETAAAAAMTPFMGTLFIAPCLRMMGCKIGRWVFLETTLFSEFDLVEIGDYAAFNLGATIQTHLFEDRVMKSDHLKIGRDCSVGNMAVVLYATEMQRGSSLAALSVLMKGEVLPPHSRWTGIPTRPVEPPAAKTAPAAVAVARTEAPPRASHPSQSEKLTSQEEIIKDRVDRLLSSSASAAARAAADDQRSKR
jgi:non-ribosomal peptide synthetase-like protein